jgi:hypothetical protein
MDKVLLSSQAYQSADLRFVNQLVRSLFEPPEGIQLGYRFTQTSVIDVGLAIAAEEFLRSDFDYLLSMDYDILFNPWGDPNYKFGTDIKRLVDSCKETGGLVAGPYLVRGRESQLCCAPMTEGEILIGPGGGLQEVRWVPTGFTCISRKILETMAETLPLAEYDDRLKVHPFFLPYIWHRPEDGKDIYLSLDFAFSQRCRDLGFKIYIDTRIVLGHLGQKIFAVMPGDEGSARQSRM